jgi:hypothetical protein
MTVWDDDVMWEYYIDAEDTPSMPETLIHWCDTQEQVEDWRAAVRSGEISYDKYLRSDWWKAKRQERLAIAGHRCEYHDWRGAQCSAREQLDVHHLSYAAIAGEDAATELVVLCRRHHMWIHRR